MPRRTLPRLLAIVLALTVAGCTSPSVDPDSAGPFAAEGLQEVHNSGFEAAWIHPDSKLPAYRSLAITALDTEQLVIDNTTAPGTIRSQWQLTPERRQRLQALWADASRHAFRDYDLSGAGQPLLRIDAALTRVTPGRSSSIASSGGGGNRAASYDAVHINAEFRLLDATSGRLLGVIRDRRTLAGSQWSRGTGVELANTFSAWARLLETRISGR